MPWLITYTQNKQANLVCREHPLDWLIMTEAQFPGIETVLVSAIEISDQQYIEYEER